MGKLSPVPACALALLVLSWGPVAVSVVGTCSGLGRCALSPYWDCDVAGRCERLGLCTVEATRGHMLARGTVTLWRENLILNLLFTGLSQEEPWRHCPSRAVVCSRHRAGGPVLALICSGLWRGHRLGG